MGHTHIYIIGCKGIPAMYGGFETFVEKLTENKTDNQIVYHVACMRENSLKSNESENEFIHNSAHCFNIDVPNIGSAKAVYYDLVSLDYAIKDVINNNINNPIFYVLACRIGPFIGAFQKKIAKIDGKLIVNPDGHEWMRAKWSLPIRRYWKLSEKLMVKHSDLLVCDSKNIKKYIEEEYKKYKPQTHFIAYGTDLKKSQLTSSSVETGDWFKKNKLTENQYYLVVGRFVPENNYETMVKEFMKSKSTRDLVLVTNVSENKFYEKLKKETAFLKDKRIKFVGTVYDQELLKYIRENAFAYIHGHEVGGTNPSLLEALYSTRLNLLLDVGFNKEVGQDGAVYWNKNNLSRVIEKVETMDKRTIDDFDEKSKNIIVTQYSWKKIVDEYQYIFINI